MDKVRVRYAPSPTGHLHIGNARTALFNYLFAKHYHGDFVLRIEDTDIARNVEGGEESQLFFLNWLGIEIDEGPQKPNPQYAPYRQTERLDIYQQYVQKLLELGYAYKCFCSSEEIEEDYQKQSEEGISSTRYNRRCLGLTPLEVQKLEQEGKPYSIRLKVPDYKTYVFHDIIRGEISFNSKDIGDFVIVKSNGIPTYNFAVVIDDHLMAISHVFRGEEHLSNTPKQLMIYQMLGWEAPTFGHLTIIVNENHKKLSKRDNSIMQFMSQYRDAGYLPQAMLNFMALLGWCPPGEEEIFSKEELIGQFNEKYLSKSPSMFDKAKLAWVNNRYIKKLNPEQLLELTTPFLLANYKIVNPDALPQIVALFGEQLSYGQQIVELAKPLFSAPDYTLLGEEEIAIMQEENVNKIIAVFKQQLTNIDELDSEKLKTALKQTQLITNCKGKMLYMPLRIVITGQMHGPDFTDLILVLGLKEVIARLESWH